MHVVCLQFMHHGDGGLEGVQVVHVETRDTHMHIYIYTDAFIYL